MSGYPYNSTSGPQWSSQTTGYGVGHRCHTCGAWVTNGYPEHWCRPFPTAWLPRCDHCYCTEAVVYVSLDVDHLVCCKCSDKRHKKFIAQSDASQRRVAPVAHQEKP